MPFSFTLPVRLVVAFMVAVGSLSASPAPAQAMGALPTEKQWRADVSQVMAGSRTWLDRRVARAHDDERLAINFDIDNSSLASQYDRGAAIPQVLRLARRAHGQGVVLLFNTARYGHKLKAARAELTKAGYVVGELCGRKSAREQVAHSKQRCRARFAREGYTLIANVGNNSTDFVGGGYERAFRLPNYGGRLS